MKVAQKKKKIRFNRESIAKIRCCYFKALSCKVLSVYLKFS